MGLRYAALVAGMGLAILTISRAAGPTSSRSGAPGPLSPPGLVGSEPDAAEQTSPGAPGALYLPAVINSNMVLQRGVGLPIWGWSGSASRVTVKLGDVSRTTTSDDKGKWSLTLPPQAAGGPLTMTVSATGSADTPEVIELTNILIGEVWIASGQSNMRMYVADVRNGPKEIASAKLPTVRLFDVAQDESDRPLQDVEGRWVECSPQSVGRFSAVAFFFGRTIHKELDVPVGLINASWGGSIIQQWTPRSGYQLVERFNAPAPVPQTPTMFNAMVAPIIPFAIRGALWYQGESNVHDQRLYCDRMKALILGWRALWGRGELPFYFVQIAPHSGYQHSLPIFREAQLAARDALANTGIAQTTDLVENIDNIHPIDKQAVGRRLALLALAGTYGRTEVVCTGPRFKSMTVSNGKAVVTFSHTAGGLVAMDAKALTWFRIAGSDRKFVPATATIDGETVVVSSEQVAAPVAVRFAWDKLAQPNLVGKSGLPAWPFRTDNWEAPH